MMSRTQVILAKGIVQRDISGKEQLPLALNHDIHPDFLVSFFRQSPNGASKMGQRIKIKISKHES